MPYAFAVSPSYLAQFQPRVFRRDLRTDQYVWAEITNSWNFDNDIPHPLYEVARGHGGSFYVPASTHPPSFWGDTIFITGAPPTSGRYNQVNSNGSEYRPARTYIYVPNTIHDVLTAGWTSNVVDCVGSRHQGDLPWAAAGDPAFQATVRLAAAANTPNALAHAELDRIIRSTNLLAASSDPNKFSDSDGLISFVNLTSSLVKENPQFAVGREVCDKISNFFATLRERVYNSLRTGTVKPLGTDKIPESQWDPAVTHYLQFLLSQAGGLTNFMIINENYSNSQILAEFSTDFVRLLFDAAVVPEAIISGVVNFLQGVGKSLRASWDQKSRSYEVAMLSQCHEAVPVAAGDSALVYYPKVKYYYIRVTSSQTEFTTNCAKVAKISFNFDYTCYITALKASVLDRTTSDYKKFTQFLDRAQAQSYQDASNLLDEILEGTTSTPTAKLTAARTLTAGELPTQLHDYPRLALPPVPVPVPPPVPAPGPVPPRATPDAPASGAARPDYAAIAKLLAG